MFNTTNLIKFGASAAAALLILLFANWAASSIYQMAADDGHGDAEHAPARGYVIATAEEEDHGAEAEVAEVSFADIYAAADAAKGEKAFKKCQSCHKIAEGENSTGPSLFGVVGRAVGTIEGFAYSDGIASHGGTWTPEELNHWLEDPKAYSTGSKMVLKTKKVEDRANLIAYLATLGG